MVLMGIMHPKGGDGKLLYNHNEILKLAKLGYTCSQISEKMKCCKDIVYKVLKSNNIKIRRSSAKLIAQFDLSGNYIQIFFGSIESQQWLLDMGITKNKNAKAHIKRCCGGKESQCYGYIWKYSPNPK